MVAQLATKTSQTLHAYTRTTAAKNYPPPVTSPSVSGLETNARPRRVKFRPGEWFVRPDQPDGRVDFFFFFFRSRINFRTTRAKIYPAAKKYPPPVTSPSVLSAVCIAQN